MEFHARRVPKMLKCWIIVILVWNSSRWEISGSRGRSERRGMCPACGSAHSPHCAASQQAWYEKPPAFKKLPDWPAAAQMEKFATTMHKMAATMPLFYRAAWSPDGRVRGVSAITDLQVFFFFLKKRGSIVETVCNQSGQSGGAVLWASFHH